MIIATTRMFYLPKRDAVESTLRLVNPDVSWIGVARQWRWACHRAIAGAWTRGVLEQYVAGFETRGCPEGRPYPRSQ